MVQILMIKRLGKLQPINEAGETVLRHLKQGEIVAIELTKPRNIRFHRRLFAMLQIILENQSHYKSVEDLLDVCKLRIGHSRKILTAHGIIEVPASISFSALDNFEFGQFYDRACQWVLTEVIPGLMREELDEAVEAELLEFVSGVPSSV